MQVLIIEDEPHATLKLQKMLEECLPEAEFTALESVSETVRWLRAHPVPELAFFDIQLADGPSFEIFDQCEVNFPVVFVTAYEEYVLKAFDYHSIHYLLKPVRRAQVEQAISKWKALKRTYGDHVITALAKELEMSSTRPRRLIVKRGLTSKPLDPAEVAYLFSEHKVSFVRTFNGETYHTDGTLGALATDLGENHFFRANRQFLVNIAAIKGFRRDNRSRITLELQPEPSQPVAISKEMAPRFDRWIKGH